MMSYDNVEILFAEDSEDDARLSIRAFKKSGITNKLHRVKDGAEALDFIYCRGEYTQRNREEKPKLILLDLKMPKVSGIEVLEQIKSDPFTKAIVVVVLTSSKEDPDIKRCFQLGVNSYIVKPVDTDNFYEAIKSLGMYWLLQNQTTDAN